MKNLDRILDELESIAEKDLRSAIQFHVRVFGVESTKETMDRVIGVYLSLEDDKNKEKPF